MKIISGGQTGVDRAALDAAIALGIPHGGWCPKGRRAELETVIPEKYDLRETDSREFEERTKLNIRDSDGTIILVHETPIKVTDGTILTIETIQQSNKPYRIIDLSKETELEKLVFWINDSNIKTLNIAGPRESQAPGIYTSSFTLLKKIFSSFLNKPDEENIQNPSHYRPRT